MAMLQTEALSTWDLHELVLVVTRLPERFVAFAIWMARMMADLRLLRALIQHVDDRTLFFVSEAAWCYGAC